MQNFYLQAFSLMMTEVRSKRRVFLPLVFTSNYLKKPLLKSVKRQIGCAVEYTALNLAMLENLLSEKKKLSAVFVRQYTITSESFSRCQVTP